MREDPIKTAIIRIAEKIDYLQEEVDKIRDRNNNGWGYKFTEELEELLKDINPLEE